MLEKALVSDPFRLSTAIKGWCRYIWAKALVKQRIERAEADTRVEAILTQDTALPLRSSGPLMLGVVRIYSRKVGYLFDDCKEARERISLVS